MHLSLLLTVISSKKSLVEPATCTSRAFIITKGTKEAHSVLASQEPHLVFYSALLLSGSQSTGVVMLERAFG